MGDKKLNKRIPVDDDVQSGLRDFAYGGGVIYNVAIQFLLDTIRQPGESHLAAGLRMREIIARYEREQIERAS